MIMRTLMEKSRDRGHHTSCLVGRAHGAVDTTTSLFEHDRRRAGWTRFCYRLANMLWKWIGFHKHGRGVCRFIRSVLGEPLRTFRIQIGQEDFDFPDSVGAVERLEPKPDLLHFHGLHSSYFDLGALQQLSAQWPVVITMHDAWLVTGHCAYPGGCARYEIGCGNCPDIERFPKLKRDGTRFNFERKKKIYENSRIHVVTPSQWLMDIVQASDMSRSFSKLEVIHNGVDTKRFCPGERRVQRRELGMQDYDVVILYNARNATTAVYKDFATARESVEQYAQVHQDQRVLLQVLGEERDEEILENLTVRFELLEGGSNRLGAYYQAVDIFVHTSKCENFPTVILEAMASGCPVVSSDTGGMREQIRALEMESVAQKPGVTYFKQDQATGCLVSQEHIRETFEAINILMGDHHLRERVGENARQWVEECLSSDKMVDTYCQLYETLNADSR